MRARGQTLVLMALTMLFVVLMVCMTLGIAYRAKQKNDLQALADAAAFTNAVTTARLYNTASVLNRTMVSHYTAMAAVQAEMAWTMMGASFSEFAGLMRMMEAPNRPFAQASGCGSVAGPYSLGGDEPSWYQCPEYFEPGGPGGCTQRTVEVRSAASTFWHGGLSYYRPKNGAIYDSVAQGCHDDTASCHGPEDRIQTGISTLDENAGRQVKDLHRAINDLGRISGAMWNRMDNVVKEGQTARKLIMLAKGKTNVANMPTNDAIKPYKIYGEKAAYNELDAATSDKKDRNAEFDSFRMMLGEAVMGTRTEQHVIQYNADNLTPMAAKYYARARDHLMQHFPGAWNVEILTLPNGGKLDVRGVVSERRDEYRTMAEGDEMGKFVPGTRVVVGEAEMLIRVTYYNACDGRKPITRTMPVRDNVTTGNNMGYHNAYHDGDETVVMQHRVGNFGNDHGNHRHYDENASGPVHSLGDDELYPDEAIGFVFPVENVPNRPDRPGGNGAWGVPKMPVVLGLADDPKPLPWELDHKFKWRSGGPTTRLDLNGGSNSATMPKLAASAHGITYYHRRTAIGEPPNMLNPFWRATLVPAEIDTYRPAQGDKTPMKSVRDNEEKELPQILRNDLNDDTTANVYNKLRAKNYLGVK